MQVIMENYASALLAYEKSIYLRVCRLSTMHIVSVFNGIYTFVALVLPATIFTNNENLTLPFLYSIFCTLLVGWF